MGEAIENQGCDRHLFGLSMVAYESGKAFPLTDDPSWIKRYPIIFIHPILYLISIQWWKW